MTDEQKKVSDEKCKEITGFTNKELNDWIMKVIWNRNNHHKNKFDLVYENIMSEYLNKSKRLNKNILYEVNFPIIRNKNFNFLSIYNDLIMEDYHIFPVPKLLLDDIVKFMKDNSRKVR